MWSWRSIPFMLIAVAFLCGTALYSSPFYFILFLIVVSSLFLWMGHHARAISKKKKWVTFILILLIPTLGFVNAKLSDPLQSGSHFSYQVHTDEEATFQLTILEHAVTSGGYHKLEAIIDGCLNEQKEWVGSTGKILIYTDKEFDPDKVWYGEKCIITTSWKEIPTVSNPYAFDFKSFNARKGIHHQAFVKEHRWQFLEHRGGNIIIRRAKELQKHCIQILEDYIKNEAETSVLAALLLGEKSLIPDETKHNYAATGATHVLAVSGLHTGIIAGSILWLLQFIRRNSLPANLLKCTLALTVLWIFVFITGMAPSVMRAATMFSFILIGKSLIKRPVNIFNIIGLSAFILILLNPNIIYQVGFQLSYCALLGIIIFQDKIYRSIYVPGKILQACWGLTSLSIAAQLGTLPLTIFYFNMFPTYFWLSGIFVVPMAGILLKLGMLMLVSSAIFPAVTPVIAYLLEMSTWWMNTLVNLTADLPWVKSEGLWINTWQLWLAFLTIATGAISWHFYNKKLLIVTGIVTLFILSSYTIIKYTQLHQNVLTVYHVKGHTVLDYYEGTKCLCITDVDPENKALIFAVQRNRWKHGISDCQHVGTNSTWESSFVRYEDHTIKLNDGKRYFLGQKPANNLSDMADLTTDSTQFTQLILDGSSFKNRLSLQDIVEQSDLPVWDTFENGAFILKN